ncbi:hypothetical protein AZ19_1731 [Bordetella bronchiseptica E012]|uniref:hypothetical protein n=1 Tax=Bordetella bronchiseptica TaxID=518 RepID=UPI000461D0A9|nr:hypothetical protein [Bordetella bronchiseptica]KDC12321.1 hypothetical protein AZ19_1731 [Bordetella bronchiseptica E012]
MAEVEKKPDQAEIARRWLAEIDAAGEDAKEKAWIDEGRKIVKRYRDERPTVSEGSRFNILWSNIETILPATYARRPKAEVSRRNKDADPVARCASTILERVLQFEIDQYPDFDEAMKSAIKDRLLPGRGVAWIRFEEYSVDRPEQSEAGSQDIEQPVMAADGAPEILERSCVDYVYWEDVRYSRVRVWSEVTWIARRIYMTDDEGVPRFGGKFKQVPKTQMPTGVDEDTLRSGVMDHAKKAEIWEVWDKTDKKVYWVAKGFAGLLDEKGDLYGLEQFFPLPKPLFATQTSDQLTPVADFHLYADQANELDLLTTRINGLVAALRLVGCYDASQPALARILESPDNALVPVDNWAQLSEKGGVAGAISWVPIKDVAAALQIAYTAREQAKQVIYEITGLSDIIRGATKASETATAQDIKRQFGSLRLQERQRDIAVFATEILRIKAEMAMDLYSAATMKAMSGIMQTQDAQYADAAIMMMKKEPLRDYQIEVAADSLVALDDEQQKQDVVEFLGAAGGFIQQAVQAVQTVPELGPLAMEMLMMGVRNFKAGRTVEAAFEQFQAQMAQRPPADPNAGQNAEIQARQQVEMAKLQQQAQADQMRLQADIEAERVKAQATMQIERERMQMQNQLEQQRAQMQAEVDRRRAEVDAQAKTITEQNRISFERWKAELDASVKIETANIQSKAKVQNAATETATSEIAREVRP